MVVGKRGGKGTVPKVGSEIMCGGGSAVPTEVPHKQSDGSVTPVLASFCRALKKSSYRHYPVTLVSAQLPAFPEK